MGLTRNGRLFISAILGGGFGYYTTHASDNSKVYTVNGTSQPLNTLYKPITSSYGSVSAYVAYGTKPSDVEQIATSNISTTTVFNPNNDTGYYPPNTSIIQNGYNSVTVQLANTSSESRTYYGYGMQVYEVNSSSTFILSYYDLSEPIVVAPGETKAVVLNFDFSNI